jgi:hypothetical protein
VGGKGMRTGQRNQRNRKEIQEKKGKEIKGEKEYIEDMTYSERLSLHITLKYHDQMMGCVND